MAEFRAQRVLVIHAGALGDFVLIWPLLRALLRDKADVRLVAASSHIALARRVLDVDGVGSEHAPVARLWGDPRPEDAEWWRRRLDGHDREVAICFLQADSVLVRNIQRLCGSRDILAVDQPGSDSRRRLWRLADVENLGTVEAADRNGATRAVLYTGAGGRAKLWPMTRWLELAGALASGGRWANVQLLAGVVEREWLTTREREAFGQAGGFFCDDACRLVDHLETAAVFVGADTGPTHLSAQVGVPTIALFGPTDPAVWTPIGPRVRVIRAADGDLQRLSPAEVARAVHDAAVAGF